MASPVVANQWPVPDEEYADPRGTVYLEITDADADLVAGSVILKLNGVVAWSGDAQQNGYSVTKTAITNGFSYEIQPPHPFKRGNSVFVDAYGDDGVNTVSEKYTFWFGTTKYRIFQDLFNDGVTNPKLTYDPNNGVITETGGELKLDGPNSLNCDWWAGVANAPKVYAAVPSLVNEYPVGVLMVESRLSNFAESIANISFGGGPMLYNDDQNVYYSGFYDYVNDIRFERGIANSFSSRYNTGDGQVHPSTTAHRYRILWNNTDHDVIVDGKRFLKGVVYFWYSINDGTTWVEAFNEAMALPRPQNFGVWLKKYNAGATANAQAYVDYLELWELVPDTKHETQQANTPDPKGLLEDRVTFPTQSGDARYQVPAQPEGVVTAQDAVGKDPQPKGFLEDRLTFPVQSGIKARHQVPAQPEGIVAAQDLVGKDPQPKGFLEDRVRQYLSQATTYTKTTVDSYGHAHFIGERVVKAFLYDAVGEAALWVTPTNAAFTGYGQDGYEYIAGVQQPAGPHAPWALESSGVNRSGRADFPDRALIVYSTDGVNHTPAEVVIFDLDNYPTSLEVWMRFRPNSSNNAFYMMGNQDRKVGTLTMANGVLAIGTLNGTALGGLHLIDFTKSGQECAQLIRSDAHYRAGAGVTIATRNGLTNYTTSGVSPSLRINPEYVYSVALHIDQDVDNRLWIAVGGEDNPVDVIRVDSSIPQVRYQGSGEQGAANIGDKRQVFFDTEGWLWFTIDDWLYRVLHDYKEGLIHAPADDLYGRGIVNRVRLPYTIKKVVYAQNYLFAATTQGIYAVHRGTLQAHLAYTAADDGGGGMGDTPPDGEVIVGGVSDIQHLDAFSLDLSSYVAVATRQAGGGTLIRLLDDLAVANHIYPSLHFPGAWFHIALTGISP